ncbi:hypothetical protein FISHEDRAFT_21239, partial [Fistulina hepatica ATCC 64428]
RELMHEFMMKHKDGFAWDDSEKGHFREDFFPPVAMPIIAHTPWVLRNMPIPPGLYDKVVECVRVKIESGAYEPSNSGVPPFTKQTAESMGGRACYGCL